MPQGVIKKIVTDRGFGFISGDPKDIFFHVSSVEGHNFDDLQEGQTVEYELEEDEQGGRRGKGPRASLVRTI